MIRFATWMDWDRNGAKKRGFIGLFLISKIEIKNKKNLCYFRIILNRNIVSLRRQKKRVVQFLSPSSGLRIFEREKVY